jgi:5-methylcytosine-specific restriction endonuclease McrA
MNIQAIAPGTRILRPCSTTGCPELTAGGPCESHRRARQLEHDERRGTSGDRGYDADHRRLRLLCFQRDGWRCVDCDWEPDIVRLFREAELGDPPTETVLAELRVRHNRGERHLHADHQVPIAERPDLRLDLENMRTRCDACHRGKTLRESRGTGRAGQIGAAFHGGTTPWDRIKSRRFPRFFRTSRTVNFLTQDFGWLPCTKELLA